VALCGGWDGVCSKASKTSVCGCFWSWTGHVYQKQVLTHVQTQNPSPKLKICHVPDHPDKGPCTSSSPLCPPFPHLPPPFSLACSLACRHSCPSGSLSYSLGLKKRGQYSFTFHNAIQSDRVLQHVALVVIRRSCASYCHIALQCHRAAPDLLIPRPNPSS